jgi:hypothetical protein
MACEVASALVFLHSAPEPIIHMDLKPGEAGGDTGHASSSSRRVWPRRRYNSSLLENKASKHSCLATTLKCMRAGCCWV